MRRLTGTLALALGTALAAPAAAEDLCARVTIPAELGLVCELVPGHDDTVEIRPDGGEFSALSRMTIRALDRQGADALAWTDPAEWLRRQVTVDTSGLGSSIEDLGQSPDSPFAGEATSDALGGIASLLGKLGRTPLNGCGEPEQLRASRRWEMGCDFGLGGLGVHVVERLEAAGERRWGITLRTMNEQRLRHFRAIANSFTTG